MVRAFMYPAKVLPAGGHMALLLWYHLVNNSSDVRGTLPECYGAGPYFVPPQLYGVVARRYIHHVTAAHSKGGRLFTEDECLCAAI